jgi:hypothetical protein
MAYAQVRRLRADWGLYTSRRLEMDFMLWICIAAGIAVIASGWFLVVPMLRGWKGQDAQKSRSTQVRDRPSTTGGGTAFGRLSTIR